MSRRNHDFDSSRDRRRSRSNDRRQDERDERKRARKNDNNISSPSARQDTINNKHETEDARNGRGRQAFEGKREREPLLCRFYQQGTCKKGNSCQFSHNGPPGTIRGRDFHNPNYQSNFNQDNNFGFFNPNMHMHPPIDNDVQFHANAFLEQLQQPDISNDQNISIDNNDNNDNTIYIESDDDDDEKDKLNLEIYPKIWALEDSSLLISEHLAGQVLFEKVMKLRGVNINNENIEKKRDDKIVSNNAESGGLDDLFASIGTNEDKENSVDDLFALMGDVNTSSDKNENKNSSFHCEDDNNEENETKVDDDNDSKDEEVDDDMYGDLYGDLGGQDADETDAVDTLSTVSNIDSVTNDENKLDVEVKSTDNSDNTNQTIIKHAIRKEIPFNLQSMSYDRLNIFNNAQGDYGLANFINQLPFLLKMSKTLE